MPNKKLLIGLVVAVLILFLSILYRDNKDTEVETFSGEFFSEKVEVGRYI